MKLTKLELSGFKSFADGVTLTFEDGVTAIVGPNDAPPAVGCGDGAPRRDCRAR